MAKLAVSSPATASATPAAYRQRVSKAYRSAASRSDRPSSRCRTITTARIDGGTERRPVGWNRSANNSGGNNRPRSRARNRYTEPSGSAASHQRAPTAGSSGRRSWRPRVTTTSSGSDDKTRSLPAQQLMDEPDTDQQPPSFAQTTGEEHEHGEGPHRARGLARRVYQWAERRP